MDSRQEPAAARLRGDSEFDPGLSREQHDLEFYVVQDRGGQWSAEKTFRRREHPAERDDAGQQRVTGKMAVEKWAFARDVETPEQTCRSVGFNKRWRLHF